MILLLYQTYKNDLGKGSGQVTDSVMDIINISTYNHLIVNGKQMIQMPKGGEYVPFKIYEGKLKLPFMIYADFESILQSENNEKQNPGESYTNKYENTLLAFMAKNLYVLNLNLNFYLKLNLVNLLLNLTQVKMLFTILSISNVLIL